MSQLAIDVVSLIEYLFPLQCVSIMGCSMGGMMVTYIQHITKMQSKQKQGTNTDADSYRKTKQSHHRSRH